MSTVEPQSRCPIDFDALGSAFRTDPHPLLASIREADSVRRVVFHGLDAWLVTRYDDVRAAQTDPRLSADLANAAPRVRALPWVAAPEALGVAASLANVDPPVHTRLRRAVNAAFTTRRIEALRPLARQVADDLLDALVPQGRVDVMAEFAVPFASQVIMALLGVRHGDAATFHHHAAALVSTDEAARVPAALGWLREYIAALLDAKRSDPGDDLVSMLLRDAELSTEELRALTLLLLLAGFEATSSLIGSGLLALLRAPDQLALLRARPDLVPSAVEEMLRYDGPSLMALMKFAVADIEFGEVTVRRGDTVLLSLSTANRDPRRFREPERFDITRDEGSHLGFGHGIHRCLGAPLAQLATRTAFTALLDRGVDIRLAVPDSDLVYRVSPALRGLRELPVVLG